MTDAETHIWSRIRAHRLDGASFRRQVPIGAYIVDFVCMEKRIIIEIDGGQHAESPRDVKRDAWLKAQGFSILRYWNNDVLLNTNGVLEDIITALGRATPPSLTLPRKGGGNRKQDGGRRTSITSDGNTSTFTSPLAGDVDGRRPSGGG